MSDGGSSWRRWARSSSLERSSVATEDPVRALGTVEWPVVMFEPMANPVRRLEAEVLKLSPRERARLAERLISSLDDHVDPDSERLWLEEAERRLDELLSGKVASIAADEVFRKARSSLR